MLELKYKNNEYNNITSLSGWTKFSRLQCKAKERQNYDSISLDITEYLATIKNISNTKRVASMTTNHFFFKYNYLSIVTH